MYVDRIITKKPNGKEYRQYLLRTSRREGKKTIKTTIQNITPWGVDVCEAIKIALKHTNNIHEIIERYQDAKADETRTVPIPEIGKSIGAVWLLHHIARRIGLIDAIGDTKEGRLALWQVIARTLDQGSRLSSARIAKRKHEVDFLNLGWFDEDILYQNLDWIKEHQARIENALYKKRCGTTPCKLFLYDVTSSYFEGVKNELADFGYNRDKKRGKKQIVIGLLCDDAGIPVSVEVFKGNTNDLKTFHSQVRKVSERFPVEDIVFVGDRGMIKSPQQKQLKEAKFDFITALTKPQIETLIKNGVIDLESFKEDVSEVVLKNGKRYVLKKNPVRAKEIAASRSSKLTSLNAYLAKKNLYLHEHPKASVKKALKHIKAYVKKLKISTWIDIESDEMSRRISLKTEEAKLKEISLLDGCYCLVTSVDATKSDKETVHSRYKDLSMVEHAFRTCKTGHLELRPIHVRKEGRTRAHVFVVMLSYLLVRELREAWRQIDITVEEGLDLLTTLCVLKYKLGGDKELHQLPERSKDMIALYAALKVPKPEILLGGKTIADSTKKLPSRRKPRK